MEKISFDFKKRVIYMIDKYGSLKTKGMSKNSTIYIRNNFKNGSLLLESGHVNILPFSMHAFYRGETVEESVQIGLKVDTLVKLRIKALERCYIK